jgi:hypothetical protein
MSTIASTKTTIPHGMDARVMARVIKEGYGPQAWHGPDLKAALADVTPDLAFWRLAPGRHNIAEIALHHAYCVRGVRGRLSGTPPDPFVLDGDDWFAVSDATTLSWPEIAAVVDAEQSRLTTVVADIGAGGGNPSLPETERFDLVLGITCHAVYHAGQVQLIKKMANG